MERVAIAGHASFTSSTDSRLIKTDLHVIYWLQGGHVKGELCIGEHHRASVSFPFELPVLPHLTILESAARDWVSSLLKLRRDALLTLTINFSKKD